MESAELKQNINPKERKFSEVQRNIVNMKISADLEASKKGIRYGDKITITNQDDQGRIKDTISLPVDKNPMLEITTGDQTKKYEVLMYVDSKKGFDIKKVQCRARSTDGHMFQASIYEVIKKERGIDLENLNDALREKGVKPLSFEAGGFVVRNLDNEKVDIIRRTKKKILCKNGQTYTMQVEGEIPGENYEIESFYHSHPGMGESMLIPSARDMLNILKLQVPSSIFADNGQGGFTGREYTLKKNINPKQAQEEIIKLEKTYDQDKNYKKYISDCNSVANKYFDIRAIREFEKPF